MNVVVSSVGLETTQRRKSSSLLGIELQTIKSATCWLAVAGDSKRLGAV